MAYFQGPTVNLPEGNHSEISLEDGCQPEISFREFRALRQVPKILEAATAVWLLSSYFFILFLGQG